MGAYPLHHVDKADIATLFATLQGKCNILCAGCL